MNRNITLLYIIKFSKWFMLFMPIVVPFYKSNGLEYSSLFTLQAIYSVSIVVLEIPSGYFADVIGRKVTILLGTMFGFIGFGLYSISSGFVGFMIAEITLGFGTSFISGADSAMLYDTLFDLKRENQYMKLEGRITSAGNFSESIAGIAGGFLALYSLRLPYYFQTAIAFTGIPAAILLTEPRKHSSIMRMNFRNILHIVDYALIRNRILRRNIFFSSLIGSSTLTMAWFVQPYFEIVKLPLGLYGILWTALNLTVALTTLIAYRIEHKMGQMKIIFLITFGISAGYLLLGWIKNVWALSILFFFYMIRGIATPVLKDYINQLTSSDIRATVLSIRSFIIRIIFAVFGPFIGWFSDEFSIQNALLFSGGIYLILSLLTAIQYLKSINRKEKSIPYVVKDNPS